MGILRFRRDKNLVFSMKFLFFLLNFLFFFQQIQAEEGLYDLKKRGFEQYQDVYVQGKIIEKASYAERYLGDRFAIIDRVFRRYNRPFTVLDIGSAQGYFSLRGAEAYPDSVFVMLEGSNSVYPFISDQVASICQLNSHLDNLIWLNHPILKEEIENLSTCEHFDIVLLLNILHWFPNEWENLIEAVLRMSHVTIVEIPPWNESLPLEQAKLRRLIHSYLDRIAGEKLSGVPRHNDISLSTTYYIIENSRPFTLEKTSLLHPDFGDRVHEICCNYDVKTFVKKDINAPFIALEYNWIPGINLLTYLMLNGTFPLRKDIVSAIPIDVDHKDWMPNNMILRGKRITLIDKYDPKNECTGIGGTSYFSLIKMKALEDLFFKTVNTTPQVVRESFEAFCIVGRD